jgi:hypothetical protein
VGYGAILSSDSSVRAKLMGFWVVSERRGKEVTDGGNHAVKMES